MLTIENSSIGFGTATGHAIYANVEARPIGDEFVAIDWRWSHRLIARKQLSLPLIPLCFPESLVVHMGIFTPQNYIYSCMVVSILSTKFFSTNKVLYEIPDYLRGKIFFAGKSA